jgi:hypothetical protein
MELPPELWSLVLHRLPLKSIAGGANLLCLQFAELLQFKQEDLLSIAAASLNVSLLRWTLRQPFPVERLPHPPDFFLHTAALMGKLDFFQYFWTYFQVKLDDTDLRLILVSALIIEHFDIALWLVQQQCPTSNLSVFLLILESRQSHSPDAAALRQLLLQRLLFLEGEAGW